MAESINTGILQQSVGFLGAVKVIHSGVIPGALGGPAAGAAAGAGAAGVAGGALLTYNTTLIRSIDYEIQLFLQLQQCTMS